MIKLECAGSALGEVSWTGDVATPYKVVTDREYSLKEFIKTIVSENPEERGSFRIMRNRSHVGTICYERGKIKDDIPNCLSNAHVECTEAKAGWGRTDYTLKLIGGND